MSHLVSIPKSLEDTVELVSHEQQSLLLWGIRPDLNDMPQGIYAARVSHDLQLLDDPGVELGLGQQDSAVATWDGSRYWVEWADSSDYHPNVRLVSPEPVNGSILLDTEPYVVFEDGCGYGKLAATPDGTAILVTDPCGSGAVRKTILTTRDVKPDSPRRRCC